MAMEGKDGVLSLSIAHGFPWSDIKEMSSKIIAVTDNDKPKAEKLARELGQEFFAMRAATQPPYVTLDAAMARVQLAQSAQAHGAGRRVGQCRRRGCLRFDLHPAASCSTGRSRTPPSPCSGIPAR